MVGVKKIDTTIGQDEVLKSWVGKDKQDSFDIYDEDDNLLLKEAAESAGWFIDQSNGKFYIRKHKMYDEPFNTFEDAVVAASLTENGVEDAQGDQDQQGDQR